MNRNFFYLAFLFFFIDYGESLNRNDFKIKDEIIQLDESNWDKALETFDYLVVEFMASWCSACTNLQPEYEKAAKTLLENNPIVHLAVVDASKNGNLYKLIQYFFNNNVRKYVNNYPTMKLFIKGDAIGFSLKTLKEEEILEIVRTNIGPGKSKLINSVEQLEEFNRTNEVLVIYFGQNDDNFYHFETLTKAVDGVFYGHTFNNEIAQHYGINLNEPTMVLFKKKSEEIRTDYHGPFKLDQLEHFIRYNKYGIIMKYTKEVKELQEKEQKEMLIFLYKNKQRKLENWEQIREAFKEASLELREKIMIGQAEIESEEGKSLVSMLGIHDEDLPAIRIFKIEKFMYEKYKLDETEEEKQEFTKDKVIKLYELWKTKKIKSYQKSAKPPQEQGIILEVTGDTWNEIVADRTKDVLVLYYTNGCAECTKVEESMKKVAKKLRKVAPDLLFAKINMSDNEAPDPFLTQGYPDIRFHTTRRKSGPALCKKPYDAKSLEKYVKQRVTVEWDESQLKKKEEL